MGRGREGGGGGGGVIGRIMNASFNWGGVKKWHLFF